MKKLQTNYNGGFPFELDDIRWQQDGVLDAFKGLVLGLGNRDYILSGCVVTGNLAALNMSEGYAVIDGEICFCPAIVAQAIPGGNIAYLDKKANYDPAGAEAFEDSVTHDTYERIEGFMNYAPAVPAGKLQYTNLTSGQRPKYNMSNVLAEAIKAQRLEFSNYIKFGSGAGDQVSSPNIHFLNEANFAPLQFDGTVTELTSGGSTSGTDALLPGAFFILKLSGVSGATSIKLKHNITVAGAASFWVAQKTDLTLRTGEVLVLSYDGTYLNVVSSHEPAATSLTAFTSPWVAVVGYDCEAKKNKEGLIGLRGRVERVSGYNGSYQQALTLPVGFRPSRLEILSVSGEVAGQTYYSLVTIYPTGELFVFSSGGSGANAIIFLDGACYYAA